MRWTVVIVVAGAGAGVVVAMARSMIRVWRIVARLIGGGGWNRDRCRMGRSWSFSGAPCDPNTMVGGRGGVAPTARAHSDWSFQRGRRRNCG